GTVVESRYSGKLAQELVYRTWWFKVLLFVLGTNIFFAAGKKWPWKKHQTGFIITQVGLLTLVAGGLVNSWWGTDSLLPTTDSPKAEVQQKVGCPQEGHRMIDKDLGHILVKWDKLDRVTEFPFNPGSLPWKQDEYAKTQVPFLLNVL